jgi:CheY-like chemotaxis protein
MAATILVVDDDESIRQLLRLHLDAAGYEVHVVSDAIAAGYLVLRTRPDLIIIGALKADRSIPDIPVIFLTSFDEGDHRGKEPGVLGYLTTPIRADRLLSLVAKHVPGGAHPIG